MNSINGTLVVTVLHNTGHGYCATTALVTCDLIQAIETARNIEKLGFQFYCNETYVSVSRVKFGRVENKGEDELLFVRRYFHFCKAWEEEWYDPELEHAFGQPAPDLDTDTPPVPRPRKLVTPKKRRV